MRSQILTALQRTTATQKYFFFCPYSPCNQQITTSTWSSHHHLDFFHTMRLLPGTVLNWHPVIAVQLATRAALGTSDPFGRASVLTHSRSNTFGSTASNDPAHFMPGNVSTVPYFIWCKSLLCLKRVWKPTRSFPLSPPATMAVYGALHCCQSH